MSENVIMKSSKHRRILLESEIPFSLSLKEAYHISECTCMLGRNLVDIAFLLLVVVKHHWD